MIPGFVVTFHWERWLHPTPVVIVLERLPLGQARPIGNMQPQSVLPPSIVFEGANLASEGLSISGWVYCTYCDCLNGWLEFGKKDLEAELVLPWYVETLIQDLSDEAKLLL